MPQLGKAEVIGNVLRVLCINRPVYKRIERIENGVGNKGCRKNVMTKIKEKFIA